MEMTLEQVGDVTIVRITPQLTFDDYDEFQNRIFPEIQGGKTKMAFDLTRVRFIDSAGMAALLRIKGRCKKGGGDMVIYGVFPMVMEAFEFSRLDRVFDIVDTQQEALDELEKG